MNSASFVCRMLLENTWGPFVESCLITKGMLSQSRWAICAMFARVPDIRFPDTWIIHCLLLSSPIFTAKRLEVKLKWLTTLANATLQSGISSEFTSFVFLLSGMWHGSLLRDTSSQGVPILIADNHQSYMFNQFFYFILAERKNSRVLLKSKFQRVEPQKKTVNEKQEWI